MADSRFTATKHDTDKPPMDLIPWEAMTGVAQVLEFGKRKYAPHNWRKGFLWSRLAAACLRHVFAWLSGEDNDPESGLNHIDHAICCLMFLSAHIQSGIGQDDRFCKLLTEGKADIAGPVIPAAHVPAHARTVWYWEYKSPIDGIKEAVSDFYESREVAELHPKKMSIYWQQVAADGRYYLTSREVADK